jgi:hypothetical protein
VGPGPRMDIVAKRKHLPCRESHPGRPACSNGIVLSHSSNRGRIYILDFQQQDAKKDIWV